MSYSATVLRSAGASLLLRSVAAVLMLTMLSGCFTGAAWYWATEKELVAKTISADIEALRTKDQSPDLLVVRLRNVEGIEDGLYTFAIPRDWRSRRLWHHPDNPPHLFRLEKPLDLHPTPIDLSEEIPRGPDRAAWIAAHRRPVRDYRYFLSPYGTPSLLYTAPEPRKVILLQDFDWKIRKRLVAPERWAVAAAFSIVTVALDVTPALLLWLLLRAWKRRGPIAAAWNDKAAALLHLLAVLATLVFCVFWHDWSLGWNVWGHVYGLSGRGLVTSPWLVTPRVLVIVAVCALCLVRPRSARGVGKLRLALAASSLALVAIPLGAGSTCDGEYAVLQAFSLLCSVTAAILIILATVKGVRPWWLTASAFVSIEVFCLLQFYWAFQTAICFLVGPG